MCERSQDALVCIYMYTYIHKHIYIYICFRTLQEAFKELGFTLGSKPPLPPQASQGMGYQQDTIYKFIYRQVVSKPGGGNVTDRESNPRPLGAWLRTVPTHLKRSAMMSGTGIHRLIYRDICVERGASYAVYCSQQGLPDIYTPRWPPGSP